MLENKESRPVFLFPGQGAQTPGMGKDFYDGFLVSKETFQEADEVLQENMSKAIFEGSADFLSQTKYSQIGIFVTSIAILRAFQSQDKEAMPLAAAGLSLGEYSALVASGKIGFVEALKIVQKRALFMEKACREKEGAMAAILGLSGEAVADAIQEIPLASIANYNTREQIVITGDKKAVERACLLLKERGAKKVVPLAVQGAFHSPLMQSAEENLRPFLEKAVLRESETGLVMNVVGDFVEDLDQIRANLISQVTESVRWYQTIEAIEKRDAVFYIEMGPAKALSMMNRKIGVKGKNLSIEKMTDLEKVFKERDALCC